MNNAWVLVEVNKSGDFTAIIATFDSVERIYTYLLNVANMSQLTFVQRSGNGKLNARTYELWNEDNNTFTFYKAINVTHYS